MDINVVFRSHWYKQGYTQLSRRKKVSVSVYVCFSQHQLAVRSRRSHLAVKTSRHIATVTFHTCHIFPLAGWGRNGNFCHIIMTNDWNQSGRVSGEYWMKTYVHLLALAKKGTSIRASILIYGTRIIHPLQFVFLVLFCFFQVLLFLVYIVVPYSKIPQ